MVTIDSKKLSANIESPCLIVQQYIDGIFITDPHKIGFHEKGNYHGSE